jgi:hypothetical protein
MSALLKLSNKYGSFFWRCSKFAVSPYTNTFMAIACNNGKKQDDSFDNIIPAAIIVGVLTFVVPVLPVLATFTFALASIAMLLAVATMFVSYPIALLADACLSPESTYDHNEYFGGSLII